MQRKRSLAVDKWGSYPLDARAPTSYTTSPLTSLSSLLVRATPQKLHLIGLLNERGIRGRQATWLFKHFSKAHIAQQIVYYDFELRTPSRLALPPWAATPWLLHRIKRRLTAPNGWVDDGRPRVTAS